MNLAIIKTKSEVILMSEVFAVIDTETTWYDEVMSIGILIASYDDYSIKEKLYYVISPEYKRGGMFSAQLKNTRGVSIDVESRSNAIKDIKRVLEKYKIRFIFAYNASFDYRHLPELASYLWIDIMKIAAYKQYNDKLPRSADYCMTGRLRTGYGVEPIYTFLSGKRYIEYHNAICDAEDEMYIMKMLNKKFEDYFIGTINCDELVKVYKSLNEKDVCMKTTTHDVYEYESEETIIKVDIDSLSNGDEIYHVNFGKGIIIDISDKKRTVIQFARITKPLDIIFAVEKGFIIKK